MASSAEFKSLRESLQLTTKWLSRRWGITENSIQRWERNRLPPDDVVDDLQSIAQQAEETIIEGVHRDYGTIEVPRLDRDSLDGFPASYHRMIARRIAEQTGAEIVYDS